MGRVTIRCIYRCHCRPQRVDGHQVASGRFRNVSVFIYHEWPIRGAFEDCRVRLRVVRGTTGGGHKFKVRHIIIAALDSNTTTSHSHM
mmetsp:Transcript_877/g.1923  ORF Transcript_877/g.1923 Transcript_877/m.1923 type:complete len:88 (+) Transcript_877:287-550(+)